MRIGSLVLLTTCLLASTPACGVQATDSAAPPGVQADTTYSYGTATRDGTGKYYMGREIAQVMGHLGAGWLERPEREREERPGLVIDAMALDSADVVADIGAGTGYFTFRISPRVPGGSVLAVDIQPEMLALLESKKAEVGAENVEAVQGTLTDPGLPDNAVDAVLMVDAYHEFSHPREMMRSVERALKPGGRVLLIEYRGEDPSVPIKPLHKMTEAQARKELEAVGLRWVETRDTLPQQHILVFEKPAGTP